MKQITNRNDIVRDIAEATLDQASMAEHFSEGCRQDYIRVFCYAIRELNKRNGPMDRYEMIRYARVELATFILSCGGIY